MCSTQDKVCKKAQQLQRSDAFLPTISLSTLMMIFSLLRACMHLRLCSDWNNVWMKNPPAHGQFRRHTDTAARNEVQPGENAISRCSALTGAPFLRPKTAAQNAVLKQISLSMH
jgi:hypothetical protein